MRRPNASRFSLLHALLWQPLVALVFPGSLFREKNPGALDFFGSSVISRLSIPSLSLSLSRRAPFLPRRFSLTVALRSTAEAAHTTRPSRSHSRGMLCGRLGGGLRCDRGGSAREPTRGPAGSDPPHPVDVSGIPERDPCAILFSN